MLTFHNLSHGTILNNLSGGLQSGRLIGLMGPNGSGKTTLLKALAGLVPASGSILVKGRDLASWTPSQMADLRGYLPASIQAAWNLSVQDVLGLGRDDQDATIEGLHLMEILHLRQAFFHQLSSGEQTRVLLALILLKDPSLMLLDEPLQHLDEAFQIRLMRLLKHKAQGGKAILMALHDAEIARQFCDEVWALEKGSFAAQGTPREVLAVSRLGALTLVKPNKKNAV